MNSSVRELYQQVILDHNKNPKNFKILEGANRSSEGYNPLCGDRLTVYLKVEGSVVTDASFVGSGCAISKASASIMTTTVKGKSLEEVQKLFQRFHTLVTTPSDQEVNTDDMGKLEVFSGVREFPARVKCASLAWHTLEAALTNTGTTVTTE